ncbi:unnamed protein product [Protopolystoma xenopodis]|uniref:Uncharacterized protein n=1 Tax=Protopolystoma xenopodis TaxID=117903 RepID=A0A3S5CH71_9PLAT|nr:unnamed protein product [Protopolystoma xenopodis]
MADNDEKASDMKLPMLKTGSESQTIDPSCGAKQDELHVKQMVIRSVSGWRHLSRVPGTRFIYGELQISLTYIPHETKIILEVSNQKKNLYKICVA